MSNGRIVPFIKSSYYETLEQFEKRTYQIQLKTIKSFLKGVIYLLLFLLILLFFIEFNSTETHIVNRVAIGGSNTIKIEKHGTGWFSLHDVSQARYLIDKSTFNKMNCQVLFYKPSWLKEYSMADYTTLDTVTFIFTDNIDFHLVSVEPDEKTLSTLTYTDKEKIGKMKKEGLCFYAKFPEQHKKQTTRVLVLTVLTALFLESAVGFFKNASERIGINKNMGLLFLSMCTTLKKMFRMKQKQEDPLQQQH